MNNKITFGQYYHANSWIHRLDPRTKLIGLFMMMVGFFLIKDIFVMLGATILIFIIILTTKIPFQKFLQSFRMIAMLLLFTTIFQIVFNRNGDIITINSQPLSQEFTLTILNLIIGLLLLFFYFWSGRYLKRHRVLMLLVVIIVIFYFQTIIMITPVLANYQISLHQEACILAGRVFLRMLSLISLSALLTLTTKPTDLNNGIEGLLKPFKFMRRAASIMAMMISIALRSIPTLLNETQRILKAQASRGVDFNEGKIKDKIMQIISLLIPMFVISYNRSDDLACAMEARGYIPGARRSSIYILKYHRRDYLTFLFIVSFLGAIITSKIIWGF